VKFCGECGANVEPLCPTCQAANPLTNKFCHQCGGPLPGAPSSPKVPSPESYTPKHLAERILTSKAALEGERKQVTVLFADLKGSMELLADRDPEEARKFSGLLTLPCRKRPASVETAEDETLLAQAMPRVTMCDPK
jgi:hypothetical protein